MPSFILTKATEDLRANRRSTLWVIGVCVFIFFINYKYFYNMTTGPHPVELVDLENPGPVRYGIAEGEFIPVGEKVPTLKVLGQESNIGGAIGWYYVFPIRDRFLLVYADDSFDGKQISGKLTDIPDDLGDLSEAVPGLYPVMLDGYVDYALSMNLFLIIALVVFPIALFIFVLQSVKGANPGRHAHIRKLERPGAKSFSVVDEIDREMEVDPNFAEGDWLYVSDKWVIILHDGLRIYPREDLIAYGLEGDKGSQHLMFYSRHASIGDPMHLPQKEVEKLFSLLRQSVPEKLVTDIKTFGKKWDPSNPPAFRNS
ncbi:hypothetical protein [Cerasicoccus fimbriatus]|uniref:hypothetical protein n=1 Tax=Cerasicoccus fimbriatus TaxID=3014554 RepID=UPI0022B5A942|nr:hypothetical protein [Cerasicoccus sp. TK19100]